MMPAFSNQKWHCAIILISTYSSPLAHTWSEINWIFFYIFPREQNYTFAFEFYSWLWVVYFFWALFFSIYKREIILSIPQDCCSPSKWKHVMKWPRQEQLAQYIVGALARYLPAQRCASWTEWMKLWVSFPEILTHWSPLQSTENGIAATRTQQDSENHRPLYLSGSMHVHERVPFCLQIFRHHYKIILMF